jgi:predicted permease
MWKRTSVVTLGIATLGLAFGAAVAAFSFSAALHTDAMPFQREGVVSISQNVRGRALAGVSLLDLQDLAAQSTGTFRQVAVYTRFTGSRVGAFFLSGEAPRRVTPTLVSRSFFDVLNVSPVHGQLFNESDEAQVLISEDLWRQHFAADPAVLRRAVTINTDRYFVVGVLPAAFDLPRGTDVWIKAPLFSGKFTRFRTNYLFYGLALLGDGVSLAEARTRADVVAQRLQQQHPDTNGASRFVLQPLMEGLEGRLLTVTRVFNVLVVGLFAVGWINLVMLLIARSMQYRRDLAVRLSLGASWRHLFAGTAKDFGAWAALAAVLGSFVGYGLLRVLRRIADDLLPRYVQPGLDWPVVAACVGFTLLTALTIAVVTTYRATTREPAEAVQRSDQRASISRMQSYSLRALLGAELALTTLVLVCAVAFGRELNALSRWSFGMAPANVQDIEIVLPVPGAEKRNPYQTDAQEIIRQLEAVPGVRAAAVAADDLFARRNNFNVTSAKVTDKVNVTLKGISQGYFEALGIPIVQGRDFSTEDSVGYTGAVIIDQRLASVLFPGGGAVGNGISVPGGTVRVVGVVGSINYYSQTANHLYMPLHTQWTAGPAAYARIYVRADESVTPNALQHALRAAAPQLLAGTAVPLDASLAQYLVVPRLAARLAGPVASFILFLAGLGAFGIVVYITAVRMSEMAIRVSFGATRRHIATAFATFLLVPTLLGVAAGCLAAYTTVALWGQVLRVTAPLDVITIAFAGLFTIGVVLLAAYLPVRRSTRVDPVSLLKAL